MRYGLTTVTLATLALLTSDKAWAIEGVTRLVGETEITAMTRGMLVGVAVLIGTQAIVVATAVVWYLRSRRDTTPHDSRPDAHG